MRINKATFLMMLDILLNQTNSVSIHSLYKEENIWSHNEKKCPRCITIWCIEHPNEFII